MTADATTLGYWAGTAIDKHVKKILSCRKRVLASRDPEQVHQMRVGTRRLRAALRGFAPALAVPEAVAEPAIARLARELGKLRDLDVLLEYLQVACLPYLPSEERPQLEAVLQHLAKKRKAARKGVCATLSSKSYRRLQASLRAWARDPAYTALAARPIEAVLPDLLLPEVSHLLLHPGWLVGMSAARSGKIPSPPEVEALLASDVEAVHDLRKQAKRARYQLELFLPFYGQTYANWVRAIKEIQTILGDLQDNFVTTARTEKALKALGLGSLESALPTLAHLLGMRRYRCWLQWQVLQRFFLDRPQQLRACVTCPRERLAAAEPALSEVLC